MRRIRKTDSEGNPIYKNRLIHKIRQYFKKEETKYPIIQNMSAGEAVYKVLTQILDEGENVDYEQFNKVIKREDDSYFIIKTRYFKEYINRYVVGKNGDNKW